MKFRLGACAAVVLLAACSGQKSDSDIAALQDSAVNGKGAHASLTGSNRSVTNSIANAPDRGALLSYANDRKPVRTEGAFTYYPIAMSEDHAIKGVVNGRMKVPTPDGRELDLRYERHNEGLDGNWSWIGQVEGGDPYQEAVITFGENAVFASIPQGNGKAPLEIQTRNGVLYAVQVDPSRLRSPNEGHNDMAIPAASAIVEAAQVQAAAAAQKAVAENAPATSVNTIDVAVGYTSGFRTDWGSTSAALTRLTFLFQVGNEGLVNSKVNGYIRLVNAQEVAYTDSNTNQTALQELTGSNGSTAVTVPASLAPLRTARDTYGADVALLVRHFQQPEHQGCGIAWLIGANGATVTPANDAKWGYAVVSDGDDTGTDGQSYRCAVESLIHEVGHLLGSAHDVANSNSPGRYPYSYGYKNNTAGFYTIMAYGNVGQTSYRYFSSPSLTLCGGLACGTADADNVRSLNQTIPVVAQFRATVVPFTSIIRNLYAVKKNGATATEIRSLAGANNFQAYLGSWSTGLGKTGNDESWNFELGDYNRDNVLDLYAIKKMGASKTEVRVFSGASAYKTVIINTPTILGTTGTDNSWEYKVGDYNGDGRPDLYVIKKQGAGNKVELRVLNGASNFQTYLLSTVTALNAVPSDYSWNFELGDYNGDGKPDLYAIKKVSGTGRTEVQILDAAAGFKTYLLSRATVLGQTGTDNSWEFKVGDYDRDGFPDVYGIKKNGASGKTEVFIINGADQYQSYLRVTSTLLGATGSDASWKFDLL